jgi:nucleotide-binding universal stress UspA family protein
MPDSPHFTAPRLDRVVVALDFSEPSIHAATWVAQHFASGAELVLVHVIHVPAPPRFLEGRYPPAERLVETARAGAELRLRELVRLHATGLTWTEVRVGEPDEEIVRVATEYRADLIVVGRPAPRAGVWGRLGTTAQRVLRRATVPVLLAAEVPARAPSRLLVGVDDSDLIDPVLGWTRFLIERFTADAVVMHVVHPMQFDRSTVTTRGLSRVAGSPGDESPIEDEPPIRDARRWLGEQIEDRLDVSPGGSSLRERVTLHAVEGLPAAALVEEATGRGSELVIVGSRGAGTARRLLLGSVAEGVLRDSPCPVLVIVRQDDTPE